MQPIHSLGSNAPCRPRRKWPGAWRRFKRRRFGSKGLSGKGVLVAHLDTGIDGEHPSLKPAIAQFADFDATGHEIEGAPIEDSDVMVRTRRASLPGGRF